MVQPESIPDPNPDTAGTKIAANDTVVDDACKPAAGPTKHAGHGDSWDEIEPAPRPDSQQQQNHPNPDAAGSTPGTTNNNDNNTNTKGSPEKDEGGPLLTTLAPPPRAVLPSTQRRRILEPWPETASSENYSEFGLQWRRLPAKSQIARCASGKQR